MRETGATTRRARREADRGGSGGRSGSLGECGEGAHGAQQGGESFHVAGLNARRIKRIWAENTSAKAAVRTYSAPLGG